MGWFFFRDSWLPSKVLTRNQRQPFSVSVIVPVYRGGEDLEVLLRSLRRQVGCQLQIIILDSGEESPQEYHSLAGSDFEWIGVAKGEFHHSQTRLLGLARARYPLVFFTVQDACLDDPATLYKLCLLQRRWRLSALSASERPRQDADAFAAYALQRYYDPLYDDRTGTLVHHRWTGSARSRITAASLGNVACLYRRKDIERHPFQGTFAEDFRWARTALQDGLRVGKTNDVSVVHSHLRPPFYALQRAFLSRRLFQDCALVSRSAHPRLEEVSDLIEGADHWLRSIDDSWTAFASLWPKGGPRQVPKQLTDAIRASQRFEPADDESRAIFQAKVVADAVGWILGGTVTQNWPPALRERVESLGLGV